MRRQKGRHRKWVGPASFFLDFGADEFECPAGSLAFTRDGMYFESRWRFEPCTQLEIVFVPSHLRRARRRLVLDAVVVESEPVANGLYRTALLFPQAATDRVPPALLPTAPCLNGMS